METAQTYRGAAGLNFWREDRLAQALLSPLLPDRGREAALQALDELGALCGGRLGELIETAHRDQNLPRLTQYDRWGARVDRIEYCPEQLEARRLAMAAGILPPTPFLTRMVMAYLLNQNGEGGVTCPLAMTDGLITLLEDHGTPSQVERWLPLLSDPDTETPLTGGQFVTERQGGSNVSENETRAEPEPGGTWKLTGLKWFCSNPGELWVTTAKPAGSSQVALFLMPRRLSDGRLNEAHVLRLKDLSGTRGKATAEVEYRGASAELIGRASQGLALLLRTVLRTSRLHVAAGSLGMLRRAWLEADLFCRQRRVLGKPASELAAVRQELRALEASFTACALAFFDLLKRVDAEDPAADALIPLLKIGISERASAGLHRARLLMAGNATLRDFSVLPRLAEDALIQEIWEGTHAVMAGHALKALRRPASRAAFDALLDAGARAAAGRAPLAPATEALTAQRRDLAGAVRSSDALAAASLAFDCLTRSLLLSHADGPADLGTPFSSLSAAV